VSLKADNAFFAKVVTRVVFTDRHKEQAIRVGLLAITNSTFIT